MATIADLHTSISDMSEDRIFNHIRDLRSLRREIPVKSTKKTTKRTNKKQITIEEHLKSMKDVKREELLKRLLEIRGRVKNDQEGSAIKGRQYKSNRCSDRGYLCRRTLPNRYGRY